MVFGCLGVVPVVWECERGGVCVMIGETGTWLIENRMGLGVLSAK